MSDTVLVTGLILLTIASLSALAGLMVGMGWPRAGRSLRWCQVITLGGSVAAFGLLAAVVANGDARVAYAVAHRAVEGAPWSYRLAAVWGGQAGALLLWCVEMAVLVLLVNPHRQARAVALLCGIQGCLLGLVILSNPFAPPVPGTGGGLHPLLQDTMMLIHPPMLFLGYALLAVPYAVTVGALIDRDLRAWPQRVWPWVMVAWLALTAGYGFGAVWAYKTFGWGGFWAWDPVENISLVPWMLAAATVHALWLARRDSRWLPWAAASAMSGFLTVLYGSFLVRSGSLGLASVHAYIEGERLLELALGILLAAASTLGVVMLAIRWRRWRVGVAESAESEQLAPVAWGAGLLVVVAGLVLVGLSLPVLGYTPGPAVYNAVLLPVVLALMVMLGWRLGGAGRGSPATAIAVLGTIVALAGLAALWAAGLRTPGGLLRTMPMVMAPLLLLACTVVAILALRQFAGKGGRAWTVPGALLAHLGVAILLVGALVSGYGSRSARAYLAVGQEQTIAGGRLSVREITRPAPEVARARLSFGDGEGVVEIEQHPSFNIELRRAWINRRLWGDVYITPLAILAAPPGSNAPRLMSGAVLEVSVKPGMPLVWLGIVLIAAGIIVALFRRAQSGT